jgi:hypothetical protein
MWQSKTALDCFFFASLFCREVWQYSSKEIILSNRCSIGVVSGRSSIVVRSVGISHSMGMMDSTP